jgi:ATP-dependent DNA helicase PIF1
MAHRSTFECVDDLLRRVMKKSLPFGGKVMILLGDFRQTCPVIPRGSRAQVVDASIQASPLWSHFSILHLVRPVRNAEDPLFADFVNSIGDGAGPDVSLEMLQVTSSITEMAHFAFPDELLHDPYSCLRRAILAPTHKQVDEYNDMILHRLHGDSRTYLAADSIKEADECGLSSPSACLDYVARQTPTGIPSHRLLIKIGGIYRLLRNFSISKGLVKNVRVVITQLGTRLITVRIIQDNTLGQQMDEEILLLRITFTHILHSGHTLCRRQFPLMPAYCTTFNSCQGLNLDAVAVDLTRPVFSHGQLYTVLSRIRHRSHARIRLQADEKTTTNITYEELLLR